MADNSTDFDPRTQVITMIAADGMTTIPIPVPYIDWYYIQGYASEINYGAQIGASFIMLLVILLMTPKNRFARTPTIINIAGLCVNIARCILLSLFFTSDWLEFYTSMTGDATYVPQMDFNISVVATAFSIPLLVLVEAALAVQAWAMIQLWPAVYKWPTVLMSMLMVLGSVILKFIDVVIQCRFILFNSDLPRWPRVADLAMGTASISWFCFLFIIRLIMHMYTRRTLLPSAKGLSAMEVLVMTNGILMLIPVCFAGLEWGQFVNFESGSLTFTSVFLVLPLGTLVAQRIANPSAFSLDQSSKASSAGSGSQRQPFLKPWNSNTASTFSGPDHRGVVTKVASDSSQEKHAPVYADLARVTEEDLEAGVRVDRQIEHREQLSF